jgi:PIN domain nuclease of toxin-antitoxin system
MDVAARFRRARIYFAQSAQVILLDTHALLWIHQGKRRARSLIRDAARLYASPVSLLELQMLVEVGRLRLRPRATVQELFADDRWLVDEPPSNAWFSHSLDLNWTRDPFDRLLVAHARLRGWKLATADAVMLEHLAPSACIEL